MKIIPSILTNDLSELTNLIAKAEGVVNRIQIDVIDHKFADNITVDPTILKNINTFLNLDFHLMVKDPINWIDKCTLNENSRIIGQIEEMTNQKEFVEKVMSLGSLAGLGIDLQTPVDQLDQELLSKVDVILLQSVPAGLENPEFNMSVWEKIEKIVKIRGELSLKFKILVDGGVTKELVNDMEKLGVDEFAVSKKIFEPDLKENLKLFL